MTQEPDKQQALDRRLLNRYDFELLGDSIETDFQGLVLGPKPPIRIRYRRRALAG